MNINKNIIIKIPIDNKEERKYIVDILLNEFLGLKYKFKFEKIIQNYEIVLENGNKLIIEDHFFSQFPKDLEYLDEKNIPLKVEFNKNEFIVGDDIPIIYGTDLVKVKSEGDKKVINCGIDIFASSFFMLTRWEEYVNKTRDMHNRFPAYASLAYKNNLLNRPVVNEYVEMLWNMLKFLGCRQERKKREFELVLTHDVDHAHKYTSLIKGSREFVGDLIKRKNIRLFKDNLAAKVKTHMGLQKDPFDTYDYLMDVSEKAGVKSYFFLHSSSSSKMDSNNDKFLKKVAEKIKKRGHYIGYHPGYDAYNNFDLFIEDKKRIESTIEQKLTFGRQHFLRFEVPITWQTWERAGMGWDSTLSYADKEGFRCGTCCEYSVFDILNRKKLKLKERPLIVMEGTLVNYQNLTPEEAEERIKNLADKVKKYNGQFVFLWHNSSFGGSWKKYEGIYEKVICSNLL